MTNLLNKAIKKLLLDCFWCRTCGKLSRKFLKILQYSEDFILSPNVKKKRKHFVFVSRKLWTNRLTVKSYGSFCGGRLIEIKVGWKCFHWDSNFWRTLKVLRSLWRWALCISDQKASTNISHSLIKPISHLCFKVLSLIFSYHPQTFPHETCTSASPFKS